MFFFTSSAVCFFDVLVAFAATMATGRGSFQQREEHASLRRSGRRVLGEYQDSWRGQVRLKTHNVTVQKVCSILFIGSPTDSRFDQLAIFAEKAAREVGTEGKLGVQAEFGNVQGIWQEMK
jgi:hypothetical protein